MPWDAKLGLLAGVGVILMVALVYHRPDGKGNGGATPGQALPAQRAASLSPMLPAALPPERE